MADGLVERSGTAQQGDPARSVVITGLGVVAPNGCGLEDYTEALRGGVSGIRHYSLLEELKFGCTVGGVPQGVDEISEAYFRPDELLAMNSSHRFGCIAAVDAWVDAGWERPDPDDDQVYWEAGAVLGTGIGGLDTAGEKLIPFVDAGRVRRLGSTMVEQVMGSGVSARVAGLLALGNQVTANSRATSVFERVWQSACSVVAPRVSASMLGPVSIPCGCSAVRTMTSRRRRRDP
jgi:3-oxoacyl-(acyl-carrier-protein) synthase